MFPASILLKVGWGGGYPGPRFGENFGACASHCSRKQLQITIFTVTSFILFFFVFLNGAFKIKWKLGFHNSVVLQLRQCLVSTTDSAVSRPDAVLCFSAAAVSRFSLGWAAPRLSMNSGLTRQNESLRLWNNNQKNTRAFCRLDQVESNHGILYESHRGGSCWSSLIQSLRMIKNELLLWEKAKAKLNLCFAALAHSIDQRLQRLVTFP